MSMRLDWRLYVNSSGDFELSKYLYTMINSLMKNSLDFGTMLSEDPAKLRAYKEQTKSTFKRQWLEVAQALESFDIVTRCECQFNVYCEICGGSRYRMNDAIAPDRMREISMVIAPGYGSDLADKLDDGLTRALEEIENL